MSVPFRWTSLAPNALARVLFGLAVAGFVLGGLESVLIRGQLAHAGAHLVKPSVYHQILTLHGVSMVFLCVFPAILAFALGLLPARMGATRAVFPRLAAFGVWTWVCGAAVLHLGLLLGGTSGAGMLGNASMTSIEWAARDTVYRGFFHFRANGVDWWATALALVTFGAVCVVIEVLATVFLRRSPEVKLSSFGGFTLNGTLSSLLTLVAFPVLCAGMVLLQFDRLLGAGWFVPEVGADPTLWSRLTALLGHPQVSMMLTPAMGLATEAVVVAGGSRPMSGRAMIQVSAVSLAGAGLLSWIAQLTPAGSAFALSAMPIAGTWLALAIVTAIFAWLAYLWGRPVASSPALWFALGAGVMTSLGAFSMLPLALQPESVRQVGSYYTVAHAHEMLFGGVVMGLLAGLYLHAPRLFARTLDARAGQVHFSLTVVGAVLTFLPMHVLGLAGMPRRIHSYLPGTGWDAMNALASVGAIVLLAAGVAFVLAIVRAKPVEAPAAVTPASSTSDGPLLTAVGLALLAVGTLLGWLFGGAGALLLVFGVVRSGTVRTGSPAA